MAEPEINLEPGMHHELQWTVTPDLSAPHLGSGTLRVFATPAMVALIENACSSLVQPFLPEGHTTVGVLVHVQHLAATPVGDSVVARVELQAVEGNLLTFNAEVSDSSEVVGRGHHQRAIIEIERFLARVAGKSAPGA